METLVPAAAWLFTFAGFFLVARSAFRWFDQLSSRFATAGFAPTLQAWLRTVAPRDLKQHVSHSLSLLGEPTSRADEVTGSYLFSGVLAALAAQAVALLAFRQVVPFAAVATAPVVVGFLALDLRSRGRARITQIGRDLPGLLNTLNLLLNAGSTLENALQTVAQTQAGTPLGKELGQLTQDRQMGLDRASAFRALAERVPRDDLRSIAAAIELAERLGTPLAETLQRQSEEIMRRRVENATRMAKEAAVKLALPNTLIMIAIALLIAGGMLPNLTRLL